MESFKFKLTLDVFFSHNLTIMAHLASLASVLATIMEKHQPLGILPVPWHVGQVSPAGAAFMDPYGGKCISVFTFSIPGVGPSGVDKTILYL